MIEESSNVDVDHPVIAEASLPRHTDGLKRRPLRSVAIGVRIKVRLNQRLQLHLDHRLSNTICDRWYS